VEGFVKEESYTFTDMESLSQMAASMVTTLAAGTIGVNGIFSIALSGGDTPVRLFALLGSEYSHSVQWRHVHVFWVDERCVSKDSGQSNFKRAYDSWLSRVPIPASNIHRIKGEMEPEIGALQYEDAMRDFFGGREIPSFDLIILGVGEDGHTASLFPGTSSLEDKERLAIPVYADKHKSWRITLTLPVLNNADHILFLVTGASKAEILSNIFDPEYRRRYPAGLIQPAHGTMTWFIDEDAAKNLSSKGTASAAERYRKAFP